MATHSSSRTSWESIYHEREPLSGMDLARDTIAVIYSGYLSAEHSGLEGEIRLPRRGGAGFSACATSVGAQPASAPPAAEGWRHRHAMT
jgi:hypothetical protein